MRLQFVGILSLDHGEQGSDAERFGRRSVRLSGQFARQAIAAVAEK